MVFCENMYLLRVLGRSDVAEEFEFPYRDELCLFEEEEAFLLGWLGFWELGEGLAERDASFRKDASEFESEQAESCAPARSRPTAVTIAGCRLVIVASLVSGASAAKESRESRTPDVHIHTIARIDFGAASHRWEGEPLPGAGLRLARTAAGQEEVPTDPTGRRDARPGSGRGGRRGRPLAKRTDRRAPAPSGLRRGLCATRRDV